MLSPGETAMETKVTGFDLMAFPINGEELAPRKVLVAVEEKD